MADVLLTFDGDLSPIERKINGLSSKSIKLDLKNNLSQPLGRISADVSEFNKSLEASNARVLAFGASAGAVYAVQRAFSEIVKSTVEVEKSLADINAVLGSSGKTLADFGRSLFDVARNTGSSFSQVASAATELSRQGLSVQETLKRTNDALILTRLSGLEAAKSVEALTAAVNSYGRAGLSTTEIINKFATVDAAFAVSSADLAEAISRVGSTAQDVGVSLDQLVALVTAAQQTTARGGAVIGNSFKTIFTRIQRSDTLDQLEQMGVKVRDLQGNALPAVQVLQNLAGVFNTLSGAQKASVAETVGGVYQMNILRATLGDLSKQYSTYGAALNTSLTATDQATKRNEQLNQTLASMINKTMVNFKQASSEIGNLVFAPTIKTGTNTLDSILADFTKPEEARSAGGQVATQLLKGIGEFLQGPGVTLVSAAFIKIFAGLTTFSAQAFKGLMGITSGADQLAAAQTRINSILSQNPNLIQAIISKNASLIQVENQLLQIIEKQNQARAAGTQLSTKLAPAVVTAEAAAVSAISKGAVKRKAGGFIPNFALDPEIDSANKLGYYPSKSFEINHPILGKTVVNDKEKTNAIQVGDYPPGSFIINPKQENMMKGIPLTDIVNYAKGYIPNFENTPKIVNAQNFATMLVPQGGGSSQYQFKSKKPGKQGITVTWPVAGLNTKYKDNQVMTNIAEKAENVASTLMVAFANSIRPPSRQILEGEVQSKINEAGGARGSINSFAGAVFEAGIKLGLDYKAAEKEGIDFDVTGGSGKLKDLFPGLQTQLADFKINQSSDSNRKSMAEKILKAKKLGYMTEEGGYDPKRGGETMSSTDKRRMREKPAWRRTNQSAGFIPNFIEEGDMSSIMESMTREQEALKARSGGRVKLGQDSRLISSENPNGYGIYNTLDEPTGLGEGIDRYNSISEARKAGRSKGFIPNFADGRIDPNKEKNDKLYIRSFLGGVLGGQLAAYGSNKLDSLGGQSAYVGGKTFEGISQGAMISDLFGGKGMKTTMAATAITSLVEAINDIQIAKGKREIEEFNKNADILKDKINELSASSQQFTQKLDQMDTAMKEGKDTSEIRNTLLDIIKTLPLEQQKTALEKFQKNPNEVPEYLNQAQIKMAANKNDLLMAAQFQQFNPSKVGLGDKLSNFLGGDQTFLGKQTGLYFGTETKNPLTDSKNVNNISSGIMGNILAADLAPEQTSKLSQDISSSKSIEDFINILKKVSEGANISTKSLDGLQGILNQFPQSADRVKMSTLEMIKANLQAEREKLKSGLTQTQVTQNYKGAAQILDYDYLQSPFGKESRVGQLASAGVMFSGINPFQDKSKTGQSALQASSILGNMGMSTETIGKIFPEIKEKSLKFLGEQFDQQTEETARLGNTGMLGKFNEEEFRKSRSNIRSEKIAEAAYGEKNIVNQDQGPDITKMGTIITEANTKLNDTINASMTALDQTIANLDKTITDLSKKIENNKQTETAQNTEQQKNPILDAIASILKSQTGTAVAVGAGTASPSIIKGLFNFGKSLFTKGGSTALGEAAAGTAAAGTAAGAAATGGAAAVGTGAAATGGAAAVGTGAAATGGAATTTAAIGGASMLTTILSALGVGVASFGAGYGISKATGLGEEGGGALYNLMPNWFESFSGAYKNKLTPEEQKTQDEAIANRNQKDFKTPTNFKEGTACCKEEIDIERQILNTIIEIKNFLPNLAKTNYIGGVINPGSGAGSSRSGSAGSTSLGNAIKDAESVTQIPTLSFPFNKSNLNNIDSLEGNYQQDLLGRNYQQDSLEKFGYYGRASRYSNFVAAKDDDMRQSLYSKYSSELKNPDTYKDFSQIEDEKTKHFGSRYQEILDSVSNIQRAKGYSSKEERVNERRRTGFEDSGWDKGYTEWEQYVPENGVGMGKDGTAWREVPEQKVLSRALNTKTGMIKNIMADGSSRSFESELRQKEKEIFMDQASARYGKDPATKMMRDFLNQRTPDQNGRTGFENLQASNRLYAPNVPAPSMDWKQENNGKITAAPGSVTPPSFMNENTALPVDPTSLFGDKLFRPKQQFLNPFKSLGSNLIYGEGFTDTPFQGMGNLGGNIYPHDSRYGTRGHDVFGLGNINMDNSQPMANNANPPLLNGLGYNGGGWNPEGPFDISSRYLGALNPLNAQNILNKNIAGPGEVSLPFNSFNDKSFLQEQTPTKDRYPLPAGGMFDPNIFVGGLSNGGTNQQQEAMSPINTALGATTDWKAKEKAGDEAWNAQMDQKGYGKQLWESYGLGKNELTPMGFGQGREVGKELTPMGFGQGREVGKELTPMGFGQKPPQYNQSNKGSEDKNSEKMVQELQKISKNSEMQKKETEKSQIDFQKTPQKEQQGSKDKKDETNTQKEDPLAKTSEMLQQLTTVLSSGFSKMSENKETDSRKSKSESEKSGGSLSVSVSASSNVNVSAKMDPGEIEGKIKAIVSAEISQLQGRLEAKISALQGSPQPPKGKGSSPSQTV